MKTTEQYFQEFYNEVRHQIEQGSKADFTRANQIWAEYQAAQQSVQPTVLAHSPNCALVKSLVADCNCGFAKSHSG